MVEIKDGKAVNIGPRSAHIANLEYEVYTDPSLIVDPVLKTIQPMNGTLSMHTLNVVMVQRYP